MIGDIHCTFSEDFARGMSFRAKTDDLNGIAANQLHRFVEHLERLEEEKALQEDINEVYAEAKPTASSPQLSVVCR
jgi:hypothetical protein